MRFPSLPLLALPAALVLPTTAQADVVRHALVVGSNAAPEAQGATPLVPLRYAHDDAARMAELLVELGGFDHGDVTVLHSPSAAQLDAALAAHRDLAASTDEDLFLFYYSGHADQSGLILGEEQMGFDHLRSGIREVPAEVRLGVLDACRSGEITRLKGLALSTPFLDEAALSAEGEAWLTATSADEAAQESDLLRGSFFTHYLVSGLRGAADTGDGVVSLDEAYTYAFERTVARTGGTLGGTQHPVYDYRIQGRGDLPLTDVRRASARLRLPKDLAGVVTVLRQPDDLPVAEVAKVEGSESVLALPPGTYRLQLRSGGDLQEGRIGLTDGADVTVPTLAFGMADLRVASKGTAAEEPDARWASGSDATAPSPPSGWQPVDGIGTAPAGGIGTAPADGIGTAPADGGGQEAGKGLFKRALKDISYGLGRGMEATGKALQNHGERGAGDEPAPDLAPDPASAPEPALADGQALAIPAEVPDDLDLSGEPDGLGASEASAPPPPAPAPSGVAPPDGPPPDGDGPPPPRVDLRHSPALGMGASLLLPGAGQAYNGQWLKGGVFLGSWALATGGSYGIQAATDDTLVGWNGAFLGVTPGAMIGTALHGWAAADAWQFHKQERHRPVTGVSVGYSTAWRGSQGPDDPTVYGDVAVDSTGLTVDWTMAPGFSLGLDRTGFLSRPDGTVIVDTGARMTWGVFERSRIRPALFVFGGLEVDTGTDAQIPVRSQAGFGGNVRAYLTPRYYLELEGRGTWREDGLLGSTALGIGVHFGVPGQGRPGRKGEGD